jgi:hypothetical protein
VFFAVFVCLVAVQMILNLKPSATRELPGSGGVLAVGTGIGAVSALVAIGGGAMTVPFLTWCNVRVQQAIGTSAAIGFPIAVGGSLGYLFNGWEHPGLPPWSLGYVYLPALAWLVPIEHADRTARGKMAHRLPVATLKRLFAGLLVVLAGKDVVGSLRLMQAISGRWNLGWRLPTKSRQTFTVILAFEESERGPQLFVTERRIVLQAAYPLLVPGRHERRAGTDATGAGAGFGDHFGVSDDAVHETLGERFRCPDDAAFEQQFEHRRPPGKPQQAFHLARVHRKPQFIDGHTKARRLAGRSAGHTVRRPQGRHRCTRPRSMRWSDGGSRRSPARRR